MSEEKIVHFVAFETSLDDKEFLAKWQEYTRSSNSDKNVTMQQSVKEKGFSYLVQHRCATGELQFIFEKNKRSSRVREVEITAKLAGGYSVIRSERSDDGAKGESKIFAFLSDPSANLDIFRQLSFHNELNIYQAYYENCKYAYILEFFVKTKYAASLVELLQQHEAVGIGVYKKCSL